MEDAADQTTDGRSVYDDALLLKSACFFPDILMAFISKEIVQESRTGAKTISGLRQRLIDLNYSSSFGFEYVKYHQYSIRCMS